jgi:hypothetical protein
MLLSLFPLLTPISAMEPESAGQIISVTIPGTEQMGSLDIAAKGHVLTEAEPDGKAFLT